MTIQEKFGLRVKELRLERKLSQEQLANIADIDRTYMTSLENGKRNVSLKNIEKIVNSLNVGIDEFFAAPPFQTEKRRKK